MESGCLERNEVLSYSMYTIVWLKQTVLRMHIYKDLTGKFSIKTFVKQLKSIFSVFEFFRTFKNFITSFNIKRNIPSE